RLSEIPSAARPPGQQGPGRAAGLAGGRQGPCPRAPRARVPDADAHGPRRARGARPAAAGLRALRRRARPEGAMIHAPDGVRFATLRRSVRPGTLLRSVAKRSGPLAELVSEGHGGGLMKSAGSGAAKLRFWPVGPPADEEAWLTPVPPPAPGFPWLRAFVVLAAAYAVVFWPALSQPWWSRDDYTLGAMGAEGRYAMAMQAGRPAYILLFETLPLDNRPDAVGWNVALRAGRALLHVLAALLLAYALWRPLGSAVAAVAAVLPFLLWFFNPDAVLMRLAAGYPLALLLAVAALLLVRAREGPAWRRGACW